MSDSAAYLSSAGLLSVIEQAWTTESQSPDPPIAPDYDDLARLHELVLQRRAMTVLEFGAGFSSLVVAHALEQNSRDWEAIRDRPSIRNSRMWELVSVDSSQFWLDRALQRMPPHLLPRVTTHQSDVAIGLYRDQVCHYYTSLPDVVPDFVYLDGPDPAAVRGEVRGLSFRCTERTVMSGDLLVMEPTFLPGMFILVDGRTNNARFLDRNFTRPYKVDWNTEADVTTFELVEPPLGPYNIRPVTVMGARS